MSQENTRKCSVCGEVKPYLLLKYKRTYPSGKMTTKVNHDGTGKVWHGSECPFCYKDQRATFVVWRNMMSRCYDKGHKSYKDYGARGITVCLRWRTYANFLSDMGKRPAGLTLERLNNARGYSKANCKWATVKEQTRNTRGNTMITWLGETKCLVEWCEDMGITPALYLNRLRQGWDLDRIFTEPVKEYKRVLYEGKTLFYWAKKLGVKRTTLLCRLSNGWSVKEAVSTPALLGRRGCEYSKPCWKKKKTIGGRYGARISN
jgi:hypothetical protein